MVKLGVNSSNRLLCKSVSASVNNNWLAKLLLPPGTLDNLCFTCDVFFVNTTLTFLVLGSELDPFFFNFSILKEKSGVKLGLTCIINAFA